MYVSDDEVDVHHGESNQPLFPNVPYAYYDGIVCEICLEGDNEAELLICDNCNEGFHSYCLYNEVDANNAVNMNSWICGNQCKALVNGSSESEYSDEEYTETKSES